MKTLLNIFALTILVSCNSKPTIPRHTNVFSYVDKENNDTTKFYGYRDIDTAIYYATKENKNVLAIFSCWACMDTPGKEWKILSLYGDINHINDNFVIAWLPVDDKRPLKDTLMFPFVRWKITTVGLYNDYKQREFTNTCTQPTFCFIDSTKKAFGKILGYTNDKNSVEAFVNSGLKK